MFGLNLDPFRRISLELALNSRVSTGGWKGIERGGKLGSLPLTHDQVEFVFWCLSRVPNISKETVVIECGGKKFDKETLSLDGGRVVIEPVKYPRIKCPSIRLHWVNKKDLRSVSFSTNVENAYLLEWGMGQEMVHVAGAVAQVGVNMIGGVYVDLVPMAPYLSSKPPQNYLNGNLPEPVRDGKDSTVECIEGWKPSETFKLEKITRSQLGQLLWAGYGCTPHKTFRYHRYGTLSLEGQGKTIPSASATYTTSLYVIEEDGIFRYVNWNEEKGAATHSLGIIKRGDQLNMGEYRAGAWVYTKKGDLLREVKQLVPALPKASTYIVIASNGRLTPYFSLMEAGYAVLHLILQAQALNMASNLVVLSQDKMIKMRRTIGLIDTPIALVPIGLT
jgi:hypothetical protein